MVLFSSGGARGGLLRLPLPGPAAGAIVRNAVTFEDVVREHQDEIAWRRPSGSWAIAMPLPRTREPGGS